MKSVQKRGVTILMIVSRNSHIIEAFFLKILENTRLPWRGTFCLWDALMQLAILKRLQSSTDIRLWAGGEGTE